MRGFIRALFVLIIATTLTASGKVMDSNQSVTLSFTTKVEEARVGCTVVAIDPETGSFVVEDRYGRELPIDSLNIETVFNEETGESIVTINCE